MANQKAENKRSAAALAENKRIISAWLISNVVNG